MIEQISEKSRKIIDFLKKCNIHIEKYDDLNGMFIPRELFLDKTKFQSLSNDILELKKDIYSSGLTAFQKNADKNQKWPLLNIVRQILKTLGYTMNPGRKSDGYTLEGKKKYTRHFVIKKLIKKSKEDTLQL